MRDRERKRISMKIHGLQKMTLLDFPGRVACTVFLGGCDLRCPYCHNYELATGKVPPIMEEEELFAFLKKRQGLLDGVAITGGEPCLQPGLPAFMAKIRELGFAVKLDTNGTHPDMLETVLRRGLADYVAMDVKNSPAKYGITAGISGGAETSGTAETSGAAEFKGGAGAPNKEAELLAKIRKSIALLIEAGREDSGTAAAKLQYEFRTTVVDQLHEVEDFDAIGRMIEGAQRYYLQAFTDRDTVPFAGLSAPSKDKLEACAAAVSGYVGEVKIRGVN